MKDLEDGSSVVRICRPAFQDFHRIFPRYHDRSELNRQLQKLGWWHPLDPLVIDLGWNSIPNTEIHELVFEAGYGLVRGVRVVFFPHQPCESCGPSIWVLGGMRLSEEFDEFRKLIYVGRSLIVKERATE